MHIFLKFIEYIKINIHEYGNTVIINNDYLFNPGFITLSDTPEIRLVLILEFSTFQSFVIELYLSECVRKFEYT